MNFRKTIALLGVFILGASLYRTESRLSHFREDHETRDDKDWLVWVDFSETGNGPAFTKTPVPTPFCPVVLSKPRTRQLHARHEVAGV